MNLSIFYTVYLNYLSVIRADILIKKIPREYLSREIIAGGSENAKLYVP